MISEIRYEIRKNYGYSTVTLTEEEYTAGEFKNKIDAEIEMEILRHEFPKAKFYIRKKFIETSPYGDWRDIYG